MFGVWSIKIFMNFDYYYVLPIIKDYYKRKYYSHFVIQYFINKQIDKYKYDVDNEY